ncbi:shematrin-like protein 1 [Drosophila eugracilis]|uniref:shematrin-like protein 1 n=1 Tax=Drosophila eugracilis TaxID=29029 RepID=UPI0007E5D9C8|nr:shematrin-like protein 1 [Drosophila eugracilis]
MKFLCVFVILAIFMVGTWAAVSEPAHETLEHEPSAVDEKKTEKRGIYGFGHGYGAYGGYGGYGHGHYGGYGLASPYYGGYGYVHAAPYYGGHHGYYPYHHGHYGFY